MVIPSSEFRSALNVKLLPSNSKDSGGMFLADGGEVTMFFYFGRDRCLMMSNRHLEKNTA